MSRPLDEQFEGPRAAQIRRLARSFRSIENIGDGIRYFAVELARCLEAGLLLSALHVASSLLELMVRKLVVEHRIAEEDKPENPFELMNELEYKVEDEKKLSFKSMINELESSSLVNAEEAEALKRFYSEV
uniref:hypothetical protein n=1 Tax=Salinibacter altiplanensis TaxID=1803181 RepID=UPI00131A5B7C